MKAKTLAERFAATIVQLPVIFAENKGQAPRDVRFVAPGRNHTTFFLDDRVVFSLKGGPLTMRFAGANPTPAQCERALKAEGTWLSGKRSKRLKLADSILYPDLYPGVDWRCYNAAGRMRYDFIVSPEADVSRIRLRFDKPLDVTIDAKGGLVVLAAGGTLRHSAPSVYAEAKGRRRAIEGKFVLHGQHEVGFEVSGAKLGERVVIDPELAYGTFIGGSD